MARNIDARRKLSDLYRRGVYVRFGPEGGRVGRLDKPSAEAFDDPLRDDEVEVYVCPPSPLQRQQALSDAQAARAKALIRLKRDHDSEEYLTTMAFIVQMSDSTLTDYILEATAEDRRQEAVRDVLALEEWADMVDLQDAMRTFDELGDDLDENDPDYVAVMKRDAEYGNQVHKRLRELIESEREGLNMQSRDVRERKALEKRGELVANQRFMEAYQLSMTWHAVRVPEPPNTALFFENPRQFQEQPDEVQQALRDASVLFITEEGEAKNSPGAASGSEQSEPPEAQEISAASTPEAATA